MDRLTETALALIVEPMFGLLEGLFGKSGRRVAWVLYIGGSLIAMFSFATLCALIEGFSAPISIMFGIAGAVAVPVLWVIQYGHLLPCLRTNEPPDPTKNVWKPPTSL